MLGLRSFFAAKEEQYVPFITGAIFFGLVGFLLGLTLARAAAQGSVLGGYRPALNQVHGHLQLMGWIGLFVMGMGLRLVPRFTGIRVPSALASSIFGFMGTGLLLRGIAQPLADEGLWPGLFVIAAVLQAVAAAAFAAAILRCLVLGRREEFLYSPFFAAGVVWLAVATILNLVFIVDAAQDSTVVIPILRSDAGSFVGIYGFAAMFAFAISLRVFPVFFGRRPVQRLVAGGTWALANAGIAAYAAGLIWGSYEFSTGVRVLQSVAFAVVGVALLLLVAVLQVFRGVPHRLRASARRSMWFVRSAYGWLLVVAGLQLFFSLRALLDERLPTLYEADGVRHFFALGFVTMLIVGMSLLVLPPLARRRVQPWRTRLVGWAFLALLHGAAAARGAGSLLINELQIENGFWTMSVGGVLGTLAIAVFVAYLLWPPSRPEVPLGR